MHKKRIARTGNPFQPGTPQSMNSDTRNVLSTAKVLLFFDISKYFSKKNANKLIFLSFSLHSIPERHRFTPIHKGKS